MAKEIHKSQRESYISGSLELSREKAEAVIDAYRRKNYGQVLSSLYYAYFHIIKSLLYTKGFDPQTHEGVYNLLNLHFSKPGVLDKGFSRLFERLHKNREIADYNPTAPHFDKEDADTYIAEFMKLTPDILRKVTSKSKNAVSKSIEELGSLK